MQFHKTPLQGSFIIEPELRGDSRGFFARQFCSKEFKKMGLDTNFVQVNNSLSKEEGTLRGMHYQLSPHAETKVIRCIQGALWDVILDLRESSKTFGKWFGETLTAENRKMMVAPKGFAHGFLTLEPNTEVLYLVSEYYTPEAERGVRFDDPSFSIDWPKKPTVVSERDLTHPLFMAGAR